VWVVLQHSHVWLFALSVIAATGIFPLRAKRWQIILDPGHQMVALAPLWRATAIGMMGNNVAPARLGELARAYALTREVPAVGFSSALASLAVDRAFDAIVLIGLMLSATFAPAFPRRTLILGQPVIRYTAVFALGVAALLVVLYAMAYFPERFVALYDRVTARVGAGLRERGRRALVNFSRGLGALRSPGHFVAIFLWTVAHWLLNAFAFWLAFRAVEIGSPFSAALFVQGLIAIGVAVPSSPGFVGVFEAAATLGLAVYGVSSDRALGWALGFHILSYIPITLIGAFYFTRLGMHFGDLSRART
jgi:uncharacterized protein (TIRG00374 family)